MRDKGEFLKKNGISEKFEELEKYNPDLWEELLKIDEVYSEKKDFLEGVLQGFLSSIGYSAHIHSIRYRIKSPDSLLVKIIEKKFENANKEGKYNKITADNYFKILTDLIGVRIIIRYRYEWQEIHKLIWNKYYKEGKSYLLDYEKDYVHGGGVFIAEKPIVYYRHGEEKKNYEIFGRDVFDIKLSDIGYSSIHYIVNYNGEYIELQVRTIYDEAWSECDHDFVYKLNACPKKLVLKRCSKMLSDVTGVADGLSTFIRDYFTDEVFNQNENRKNAAVESMTVKNLNDKPMQYKKVSIDINKVSDVFEIF